MLSHEGNYLVVKLKTCLQLLPFFRWIMCALLTVQVLHCTVWVEFHRFVQSASHYKLTFRNPFQVRMEILLPTPNLNTLPLDITCTDQKSVCTQTVIDWKFSYCPVKCQGRKQLHLYNFYKYVEFCIYLYLYIIASCFALLPMMSLFCHLIL